MSMVKPNKSRGALSNPHNRFHEARGDWVEDGWFPQLDAGTLPTEVTLQPARSILTRNQSPDVPFAQSINAYRGCEHGCIYCFARPTHAYLDLSPGIDFETKIIAKPNAAALLRGELAAKRYHCQTIALGTNTDPYQPAELKLELTRQILQVCAEFNQPVSIVTKSALVERDLDILQPMAERGLAEVLISVTSLDRDLSRIMEPRAAVPARRLKTLQRLKQAGVPTGILLAPVIPFLNDQEIEAILQACAEAGAESAGYVLLRLPLEVSDLFEEWLREHVPLKADRIMQRVRDCRQGKTYSAEFGQRMTGSGEYAELIRHRFKLAAKKRGLHRLRSALDCSRFQVPSALTGDGPQLSLF